MTTYQIDHGFEIDSRAKATGDCSAAKRDRAGFPIFRRVSKRAQPGYCCHVNPLRIAVGFFPPDGPL